MLVMPFSFGLLGDLNLMMHDKPFVWCFLLKSILGKEAEMNTEHLDPHAFCEYWVIYLDMVFDRPEFIQVMINLYGIVGTAVEATILIIRMNIGIARTQTGFDCFIHFRY